MSDQNHERLAWRLTQILVRLNQGETLDPEALASEYNVSKRTIQRDLQDRFAFLPLQREGGRYQLEPAYLGQLNYRDLQRFAQLAGVSRLFPALSASFIRELFDTRIQETLNIHAIDQESFNPQSLNAFRTLQHAIQHTQRIRLTYTKDSGSKHIELAPYRLINHDGHWYLAATDQGQIKAYALGKISALETLEQTYTPDSAIHALIDNEDSIWLNSKKTEVVLTIAAPVADYFRRRKHIAQQVTVKDLEDGGLIVSGKFAHPNQILPTVRQWIPHIRIVSPEGWQEELDQSLREYLEKPRKN